MKPPVAGRSLLVLVLRPFECGDRGMCADSKA